MKYRELKDLLEKAGVNDDTELEFGGPGDNPDDRSFWEIDYEQGGFMVWLTGDAQMSDHEDNTVWIGIRGCYKDGI